MVLGCAGAPQAEPETLLAEFKILLNAYLDTMAPGAD
jgi:hypothetical protein